MRLLDPRRAAVGRAPYLWAGAAAAVGLAVGAGVAVTHRAPNPPAPPGPAALAALQNAAFAHAEAQPGLTAPQQVPVKLQRGETLEAAVRRAGVGPAEAQLAVAMLSKAMDTVHLKAGMAIDAAIAQPRAAGAERGEARLIGLSLRTGPASAITISRSFDGALRLRELDEKLRDETAVADGAIEGSLYESAQRIGATPAITAEVAKLFAHRLDFQRDIQPGDAFKLVFDRKVTEAGRTVEAGDLQYAELHGVKFYRFARGNDVEYFDEFGKNIKGFLLRTPVDGAHITSLFGMRKHPVLGYTRAHQGIDFGAGTGTPILAAGDGVVAQAGPWGGYGNWLRIRHSEGWDTGYGHISRYAAGIHPGVHVHQGQVVAYVGATGLATGPHLHYEIWKNGQRVNPIGAKVPQGTVLAGGDLARFRDQKAHIDALLTHGAPRALAVADTSREPVRLQR
ncbi:MAG TPA: M23 family metallopeptidase [Phenylobacterium sp.]|jgi:murein DD-endopeptidase MepM/ murein hydrolase activator NlpD|uniref:M23 family metallopeptidase n=1 Tax=Phenylobacterium sp. TaxID=1871053 RepID=UPI002CAFA624|nr:M23 family metallopeptidase [Phenylobacterium sp.]HXA39714.1 M23 family metallopeptidase [Phenylobacterium sp.]